MNWNLQSNQALQLKCKLDHGTYLTVSQDNDANKNYIKHTITYITISITTATTYTITTTVTTTTITSITTNVLLLPVPLLN